MNDLFQQIKQNFKNGDASIKLIFISVGVFLVSTLLDFFIFKKLGTLLHDYFAAKGTIEAFFSQPWGVLTYSFFHGGLFHLAMNMLMIYFVGKLFLRYFRGENFLTFYFYGALFGAIAFMAAAPLLNYGSFLLGASAAIYSVFFGLVSYIPKTKVQLAFININIPLDYIAYALLAYDFIMILSNDNVGGHISHLGGAAFGFLYMKQFEKGNDFLGGIIHSLFYRTKKVKQKTYTSPPRDDYEFNAHKVDKQKKVDKILDKISKSGYESLSKEEKDFLFNAGKNG